MIIHF